MRRILISLLLSSFYLSCLLAQSGLITEPQNIVPNPSFEKFSGTPIGWYYKGAHFDNVIKYWNSPTSTSPDIFGKDIRVPNSWQSKGFGDQTAYHGDRFVGITLFGCSNGKPHCREYIQIQLEEPLVIGQRYSVTYYISHLPRSMFCNNIGIYFSEKQYEYKIEMLLEFDPQVEEENIAIVYGKNWNKITHDFVATDPASYLIIGNFHKDEQTETTQTRAQDFNFAYYYFDNISVIKQRPIINVPKQTNNLLITPVKTGEVIVLENIFFDLNKSGLLPRSSLALQDLIDLLHRYPTLRIEIRGHTDNQGTPEYNQELSLRRAESVVEHLHITGNIDKTRLRFAGLGDSQPISSNETLEGRQQNRRVEFLVLNF